MSRLVAVALLGACAGAPGGGLRVERARMPAPPDTVAASVYFTIANAGPADTLTAVSADLAARAMVHASSVVDGRRQMRPVMPVPVPEDAAVTFAPGGLHVMLDGLHGRPAVGDTVRLTLTFRHAGAVRVDAAVVRYEDLLQ